MKRKYVRGKRRRLGACDIPRVIYDAGVIRLTATGRARFC